MQMKRRQHFVWKYYLTAWEINGKIFCLRNNEIFHTNPINLGLKKNIYSLVELNEDDIDLINKMFIGKQTELLNKNWIPIFNKIFEIKNLLQSKGLLTKIQLKKINTVINNLVEEFHSEIEKIGRPLLDQMKNKDLSFVEDENTIADFLYYLSVQYFRTFNMKMITENKGQELHISNFDKIWNVSSIILSTSLAFNLYVKRETASYTLLLSNSLLFITGNQPVINTLADYKKPRNLEKNEFELYYPITPKISLLISFGQKKPKQEVKVISDIQVINYNILIFRASNQQVYSNKRDILEDLIKLG